MAEKTSTWIIIVIVVAVIAGILIFYFGQRPVTQPREQVIRAGPDAECTAGQFTINCEGNVLVYSYCQAGAMRLSRYNCPEYGDEDFDGYCNSAYRYDDGRVEAACDYRAKSAAAIAGEVVAARPFTSPREEIGAVPSPGVYGSFEELLAAMPLTVYCGNNECDAAEDCKTCAEDCGCGPNMTCKEYPESGVALCELAHYCGDEECDDNERAQRSCCTDCSCSTGYFCDVGTENCVRQAQISEARLDEVVANYTNSSFYNETLIGVRDGVWGGIPVKEAYLDCGRESLPFCRTVLVIAANGTILDVLHSM
ncbi:MAG: hypothetical protein AB1626_03375 [Candidatus Micrarchaeota archaeon]